ncbi:MAG TPA: CheR family methyltransferase [Polyangiaceae bacterium]|nr:CheR family methyltransferase [Polyangiaceae bacterium]
MTERLAPTQVQRLRALVTERLGFRFDPERVPDLTDFLRQNGRARGVAPAAYLDELLLAGDSDLLDLAAACTIPETYFFRDAGQIELLREELRRLAEQRPFLRVLSAGCASGEEPYTVAMLARRELLQPERVSIVGMDVNGALLELARRGRYTAWSLRQTPEAEKRRYFFEREGRYEIRDSVKRLVTFERRNLARDAAALGASSFDIVLCRNVLMYLSPHAARDLVKGIARALVPGGLLLIGHAETLRGLSDDFELGHARDAFFYRRRSQLRERRVSRRPATLVPAARTRSPLLPLGSEPRRGESRTDDSRGGESWRSESYGNEPRESEPRGSERGSVPKVEPSESSPPRARRESDGARSALELFRRERYREALALLERAPDSDGGSSLLRGVLLLLAGNVDKAASCADRLIERDALDASAHYLLALCAEQAGEPDLAIAHDQAATYLDPAFAMPRVHLGRLFRQNGRSELARRELLAALRLIGHETEDRLCLFGGGFSRHAWVELCRAELSRCEGA